MAERINNLTKPRFPSLQFDIMNALCFALVLFATQIIYTKEESQVDQNETAPTWTVQNGDRGIDFDKVELFKDELPSVPEDLESGSNQSRPPTLLTRRTLPKNGAPATAKGNRTSTKIYEDYDTSDLRLDKYKLLVAPNRYKIINASDVRFLNRNLKLVTNSSASPTKIKKPISHSNKTAKAKNVIKPPKSVPNINTSSSVTPISWVISPACPQQNESKYVFSAIFSKKPTVHLVTPKNGTAPSNDSPKILINDSSVTMVTGKATLTNTTNPKVNSSKPTKSKGPTKTSNPVPSKTNKTTPVRGVTTKKPTKTPIEDSLLKGISEFTMTIQNNSKPQNYVTLSKVGDSLIISGQIKNSGNDEKPVATAKQTKSPGKSPSKLHANVSVKTPTVTITAQGSDKLGQIPLLLLKNNLLRTPLPGITLNKIPAAPQQAITRVLPTDIGQRSLFSSELNENFERPTKKETVGNLMTQKDTDVQSPDALYELFKNITVANVINEDLNRKMLDESQIHTQQNWQLIKGNRDILNVLKNKNEENEPS